MTRFTRGRRFHHSFVVFILLVLGAGRSPAQDVPSPGGNPDSDYRVGVGDVLQISVWKEPEVSTTVPIRPDGKISIPLVNDLEVTDKTPLEIQAIVAEKLSPFINDPNVTVIVRTVNSKKVYLVGEVAGAGAHQLLGPTTVLQILTEAGGLAPFAKQKDIYVLRTTNGKQEKFRFNYKDVIQGKKMEQNILLEPGDTIVVP